MNVLDIGCGLNKFVGAIGLDRVALPGVDVVHDFDKFPYPFPDNSFDRVVLRHCLEHVADPIKTMEEIFRIATPNAEIEIHTPHFSSANAFGDPSHKHRFSLITFDFFSPKANYGYVTFARFERISRDVEFWPFHDRFPRFTYAVFGLKRLVLSHPVFYERFFTFLFPLKEFSVRLRVIKNP